MNYFCTLFDSNYLIRGLAMYLSLKEHCPNFHLYIFAFDDLTFDILQKLNLESATIISLKEFEDNELLKIKSTRTIVEYCWTCTSSSILYAIEKFNLPMCTYLDADLLFFNNPQILINELGNNSISLSLHRFDPAHDKSVISGKYCVQFMTFKNDDNGIKALRWWRNACLDWCYARSEDNKFGDQKYLDDWTERFRGVHVLSNLGAGIAPWNISKYIFSINERKITTTEKDTLKKIDIIFFHFHHAILYKIFGQIKSSYFQRVEKKSDLLVYYCYNKYLSNAFYKIKSISPRFTNGLNNRIFSYYFIKIKEKTPIFFKKIYRKIIY